MAVPWYIVKFYFQKHSKIAVSLICLALITLIFYRYLFLTLIIWSFLMGVALAYCFVSPDFLLPNILFTHTRKKKKGAGTDDDFALMKTVCTVCGQRKCPRHRPELNILAFQPWYNLEVRQSVDQSLDEFLTIVLNEFVYTWYKDLSTDEEFVDELRITFKFFLSVVLRRAKKIDVPTMVTEKIVKAGLQHLHAYLQAKHTVSENGDIQQVTLDYLGPHLHHAMSSRKSELEYIRRLVERIFPYILRPQALQSSAMCALLREILAGSVIVPAMDAIANPDMVNNMILIFLDDTPPPEPPAVPSPMVPFLGNFSNQKCGSLSDPELPPKVSKSSLRLVLGDVMDPDKPGMLYPFMQFLKSEAAVNVLQFALSCEDFNKRILNPDLTESELEKLHNDVKDLYRNYCAPTAPDRINFEENIVKELQEVVEGSPGEVVKLRRSTPMFRAYEHVYNMLSYTFLPLFHQSEDYYTMICGERLASQVSARTAASTMYLQANQNYFSRQPKKKEFGISAIGSKIKGVFRSSDSKSQSIPDLLDIDNTEDADTLTIASASSLEEDQPIEDLENSIRSFQPHDLSTWRVTIPRIGNRPDPENPKRTYFVFIIDVRRVDVTDGRSMWTVPRRYGEFYVLEQKLKEFHGELEDCTLPAKKMMGTKNQDFIDGKREPFEVYLQKLLTKPYLKGSQLLYNFLTSEEAFDTGFDINIGRVLRLPGKLIKEKGKHLESFLQHFEKSTEASKPVPGNRERRGSDVSCQSTSSEKLCMTIYENNGHGVDRRDTDDEDHVERTNIEGLYDSLIYIARYVYKVPEWCHHLLLTARMIVKSTLESYLDWYIGKKVGQVIQEHRLVGFITLLRDVLFYDTDPPRTDDQKKQRYLDTVQGCLDFIPKPVVMAIGEVNHRDGTLEILNALQQPKLNKQLTYVFLDVLMTELFPELMQ